MTQQQHWRSHIFSGCIALNSLLAFLLILGDRWIAPSFLQTFGRAHPLLLHFPIVLLLLAFLFEIILAGTPQPTLKNIADWLLLSASLTTVLTALMGLFLSREDGYGGPEMSMHKWMGVACAGISFIWYGLRETIRKSTLLTTTTGLGATIILLITGHKGAHLTHGADFLFPTRLVANLSPMVPMEQAVIYTDLVRPLLEKKCMNCHNSNKAKGALVMETQALLLKGGKTGPLWDTTDADLGLMIRRIHLPADHKEHMPPQGKPQLTENETRLLELWIKGGASFTRKLTELPPSDSLRILAASFFTADDAPHYTFAAADEGLLQTLNTEYRVIRPLATGSPALAVNFYGSAFFNSAALKELHRIKNNIVSLHLAKMPVTDEDLSTIGGLSNLSDLNLSFTEITGEGLKQLAGLQALRRLSLSGTAITARQLQPILALKKLQSVQLWHTAVTPKDLTALRTALPHTQFDLGYSGDTVVAQLPAPAIIADNDKKVFKTTALITIKNPVAGAITRYTLDGSAPDSLHSAQYKGPFTVKQSTIINARAFLKGWISSDPTATAFFKSGLRPDSIHMVTQPNPRYIAKAKKGKAFFDQVLGTTNFNTEEWVGYREHPFEVYFLFNQPVAIRSVELSALVDIESFVMPPALIQVWAGQSIQSLRLVGQTTPAQPGSSSPAHPESFTTNFPESQAKVVKLIVKQVSKLPPWHPGMGQKAWFFLDEVFLN